MVKTNACHLVRVTSTLAVGKVAKIARRWLPELSCCLATHCGFLQKAGALFIYMSCCLAHALSARCFPLLGLTLRPSAPFCCCHRDSLTRGRLAFAQEAVRDPPSFSLFGSALVGMCPMVSSSQ